MISLYKELREYGIMQNESQLLNFRMAVCLKIFGCYPVYTEFFFPCKPSILARIVIKLFFKRKLK